MSLVCFMSFIYFFPHFSILFVDSRFGSAAFPGCRAAWHFGCSGGNFFGRSGAPAVTGPPWAVELGVHILINKMSIRTNLTNIGNGGLVLGITVPQC